MGKPQPLNKTEEKYIREHYDHIDVPTIAKTLKRGNATIYQYLQRNQLSIHSKSNNKKKLAPAVDGDQALFFSEKGSEDWLTGKAPDWDIKYLEESGSFTQEDFDNIKIRNQ